MQAGSSNLFVPVGTVYILSNGETAVDIDVPAIAWAGGGNAVPSHGDFSVETNDQNVGGIVAAVVAVFLIVWAAWFIMYRRKMRSKVCISQTRPPMPTVAVVDTAVTTAVTTTITTHPPTHPPTDTPHHPPTHTPTHLTHPPTHHHHNHYYHRPYDTKLTLLAVLLSLRVCPGVACTNGPRKAWKFP
jgi:hypothetical protein